MSRNQSLNIVDAEAEPEADTGGWVSGMNGKPSIMIPSLLGCTCNLKG